MSYVDSPSPITHVSLCAGYGGIDLGLHRAVRNLRTIAVSEIEAFACANLVAKMEAGLLDPAPIWTDLKTFPWSDFRDRVDILSGGYPCQPFSAAGKRLGAEDPRHLWPFIAAGIAAMRPGVCFFENVEGHISLGLPDVLQDLAGLGYRATWGIFSASEVGAPHQRKRIFILAHDQSLGIQGRWPSWIEESRPHAGQALPVRGGDAGGDQWPSRPGEQQFAWEPPRVVVDAKSQRAGALGHPNSPRPQERPRQQRAGIQGADADGGEAAERQTQTPLGGNPNGPADWLDHAELYTTCDNRTDELRLLGNGVVPATAERAFRILIQELMR